MKASESLVIECQFAVRAARAGKIRLALDSARLGYQRAKQGGSEGDRVLALNTMAFCQSMNGAYIESMASAMDAYPIAQKMGDLAQATQALTLAAASSVFMLDTGEMASAILDQCLTDALKIGDPSLELLVRNSRGVVYFTRQMFSLATAEFVEAVQLLERADGTTPPSVVQCNIASAAMREANAIHDDHRDARQREALRMLEAALLFAQNEGSMEAEARARYALGALHTARGEYPHALSELQAALSLSENLSHRYRAMIVRAEIGAILSAQGRAEEARTMVDTAIEEAERRHPCRELHQLCNTLADIEDRLGRKDAALRSRERAQAERAAFVRDCELARQDLAQLWHKLVPRSAKN